MRSSLFALRPLLLTLSFLLFSLPLSSSAFAAETSSGAEAALKKVTIRKQHAPAHDIFRKKIEETFQVEVVRDTQGIEKGLSGRELIPEDHGMLFVLDTSQEHAFWMKGMRFPLDLIFIGSAMQITEILENLQPCEDCPVHFPKMRPAYLIEINAGLTKRLGIAIGDTLVINK